MKDKEKQIEELGQDIYDNCPELCENGCGGKPCYKCIAESLQHDGYRKIDKDSVVLSKEEFEELKQAKILLEFREETIKQLEDANIRYAEALELKVNKKERKETAEKFVHLLADYKEYDYKSCSYKDWCVPHTIIKHIAQSVGIDIRTLNDKPTKKSLSFNGVEIKFNSADIKE